MSTLGSLMALLSDPGIQPYNAQELTENRLRLGNVTNQTELLRLAELKRQQEAEALVRAQVQNDPRVREMLFGGGGMPQSLLGSLQAPAPPPGALTQSPMPGMPGQAQSIPAYPDASRYASVPPASGGPIPPELAQQMLPQVTRPQSTLGGIGAQPQANPLLEMASRNPDAALLLQKQLLQQEDTRYKIQERQLDWRSKQAGYIGSTLQGATDQASYDTARDEIARVFPEWGARLPATYSKEAVQPFIDRALSVREKALLDSETLKTQVDLFKARTTAAGQQIVPKYTGDAQRDSLIASEMQRQGLTGNPPQAVLDTVEQRIQQGKVDVSASQGQGAAQTRALGETAQKRLEAFDKAGYTAQQTHTVLDQMEGLINSEAGVYGNSPEDRARMKAYEAGLSPNDQRAKNTAQLRNLASNLQLAHGSLGTGVSEYDARVYAKAAGDMQNAQNVEQMKQYIQQMRAPLTQAMTAANEARQRFKETGDLPAFQRQGTTGSGRTGTQASSKGTVKLETLADYAAKHNIPIGQAIRQAYDKGLEIQ